MNWDAIGAIAEVLGVIAVFVTLVYLAYQLRQNNILLKEQAKYHMLQNLISYHDKFVDNPELVKTMYGQQLSEAENLHLRRLSGAVAIFFRWNWEYLRAQERIFGFTDVPTNAFAYEYSKANLGEFWDDVKQIYDPGFVTFMDREVIPQVR